MFQTTGTIKVRNIAGAKGAFSVGTLVTPEGDFSVKDALLDQFEPGEYAGSFTIERVFLSNYLWRGRAFTEIRAVLIAAEIDEEAEAQPDITGTERDPLDDESCQDPKTSPDQDDLESLVARQETVKLDPTQDRVKFRAQRDFLKGKGYAFDPKTQTWNPKA